jgi:hypothetical protein
VADVGLETLTLAPAADCLVKIVLAMGVFLPSRVDCEYTLEELGVNFESGLGPGGGFRAVVATVLALETTLLTDAADDVFDGPIPLPTPPLAAEVCLFVVRLITLGLSETASLSLSRTCFPTEDRNPALVRSPLSSTGRRSSTGTPISAGLKNSHLSEQH